MSLIGERLSYRVGGQSLLEAVTLTLSAGEVLAVMGPNGAGKTTLLKVLSGELRPAEGEVRLNGRPLQDWGRLEVARQRAVLPQQGSLSFPFTAEEVVRMGCSPHRGHGQVGEAARVRAAMEAADVAHLATRRYPGLSGGERQRVQLARVLAQISEDTDDRPRFLLLDEPTSALDLAHQHQVLALARRLVEQRNAGVLAILHDLNLASCYADRMLLLDRGRVAACGGAGQVLREDMLERVFKLPLQVTPHPQVRGATLVLAGPRSAWRRTDTGAAGTGPRTRGITW